MPYKLVDEKGVAHSKCHGISADAWFRMVGQTRILLSKPEYRARAGLERISAPPMHACNDPDCQRLNRKKTATAALFRLTRNIEPVLPVNSSSEKERRLCQGHPSKEGSYLCHNCAIVAMTKRHIDEERRKVVT